LELGGKFVIFYSQVKVLINEFVEWLASPPQMHPVHFAALVHFKLAYIHPFENANGRTARVVQTANAQGESFSLVEAGK
jgi:Fic family protein